MRYQKLLTLFAALCMVSAPQVSLAVSDKEADILVVFPEKLAPSKVYFATDGEFARGFLIPFAAIANNIALANRSKEMGAQLDEALDGYDRYATIYRELESRFRFRSPALVTVQSRAAATYLSAKGVTAAAAAEGYDFVIAIEDKFSGLSMLTIGGTRTDDLAPATTLGFKVYDARKRTQIAKGLIAANGLEKKHYKEALIDRAFFVGAYDRIARVLAEQLVGTLFRTDKLHAMAASVGRGDEVPELAAVMKRYEKRFEYHLMKTADWKQTPMNSRYVSVLEPKSDLRLSLGLRFEVDLLIPEFGQDVSTVDEYVDAWKLRMIDQGVDLSTFGPFTDIDAPEGFQVFSLDLPGGGRQISLVRILNEDMLQMISIIFSKDFATLYPQNRKKMEQMIAAARLEVH